MLDVQFTVSSAYDCQFKGAIYLFPASNVWKAYTEPKIKFFAWLALHNKALTTHNMAKKSWPYNPLCSLCYCEPESVHHLLAGFNYIEALWNATAAHFNLPNYDSLGPNQSLLQWVTIINRAGSRKDRQIKLGILFSFWW
jgi:hypothetical protein